MYSANVHNWIEILLVGTPRPAQSGWPWVVLDGAAVPAVLRNPISSSADRAVTRTARSVWRRPVDVLINSPRRWVMARPVVPASGPRRRPACVPRHNVASIGRLRSGTSADDG